MSHTFDQKTTFGSLIKHTFPTIIMMVFFSFYTIVDGIFISRFVSSNALSATNIVYPLVGLLLGVSVMFATGGSAIVARRMGEKKEEEAREAFTLIITTIAILGVMIGAVVLAFIKPIIILLGGTPLLMNDCLTYGGIMMAFAPIIMLKMFFDYFLVTAGKPNVGLISAVLGGIINIVLDYVFIVPMNMGIAGAALGTCIGYALPCIIGVVVFCNKKNTIHFVKLKWNWQTLRNSMFNGFSEMVTQISGAITTYLYNIVMLRLIGEDGVAAITIVLYVHFLLMAAHLGFSSGVAPRISYNYGKDSRAELKSIMKYSLWFVGILSAIAFSVSMIFAPILVEIFTPQTSPVYEVALSGFRLFAIAFVIDGFNVFVSGMFTAFSNGKISALISVLRTLVFVVIGLFILPALFGVNGVWLVVPFAEITTSVVASIWFIKGKKMYHY